MNTNLQGRTSHGRGGYLYSVVEGGLKRATDASPRQNQLLASLPESVMSRLAPHLERVEMTVGDVIYQYGSHSQHVWFPATSIVSLIYDMEDGASAEVAVVGNEGMIGVGLFMAGETMPGLATVQCSGFGYRLSARILREEFDRGRALPRDDPFVIEGMHHFARLAGQDLRELLLARGEPGFAELDTRARGFDVRHLHSRRVPRHDHHRAHAARAGGQRQGVAVIAR